MHSIWLCLWNEPSTGWESWFLSELDFSKLSNIQHNCGLSQCISVYWKLKKFKKKKKTPSLKGSGTSQGLLRWVSRPPGGPNWGREWRQNLMGKNNRRMRNCSFLAHLRLRVWQQQNKNKKQTKHKWAYLKNCQGVRGLGRGRRDTQIYHFY